MADFRRLLYVFAAVAFLMSLTVPAYADFQCTGNSDNRPTRSTSYDDNAGNIVLTCTGGVPTSAGAVIPPTTITVTSNTNITSRILKTLTSGVKTQFNEALLIIDEPNTSPVAGGGNGHVMSNCGFNGEDSDPAAGPGVCQEKGVGALSAASQYDGSYDCDTGEFGCGHPNVFQGRQAVTLIGGEFNKIQFVGVPLDPGGTTTNRTLRIANIRIDSTHFGVASPFSTVPVTATVSFAGALNIPDVTVQFATVELGQQSVVYEGTGFLQCVGTDQELDSDGDVQNDSANPFWSGSGGIDPNGHSSPTGTMDIRVIENFSTAWRVRNVELLTDHAGVDGAGNGTLLGGSFFCATGAGAACDSSIGNGADTSDFGGEPMPSWTGTDLVQNVPGVNYNTEAGFENQASDDTYPTNPPPGYGSPVIQADANPFENNGPDTGFKNAGVASQGTRIAVKVGSIPMGARVFLPINVLLFNQADASVTGVMQADALADQNGFTSFAAGSAAPFQPATATAFSFNDSGTSSNTSVTNNHWLEVTAASPVVTYEILFTRADALEYVDIVPAVVYNNNGLSTDSPQTGVFATATVSFAPIQNGLAHPEQPQKDGAYSTPRFLSEFKAQADPLFQIDKCACNLLFPWVVSAGNIDTGIVIANTSLDPSCNPNSTTTTCTPPATTPFNGTASPQVGTVTFYYYGTVGIGDHNPPANLAPNVSLPVSAGGYVAHVLSVDTSATNGLGSRTNFAGYVIAQSAFQFCHGVVDITQGAAVIFNYVGLQLDFPVLFRTSVPGEALGH